MSQIDVEQLVDAPTNEKKPRKKREPKEITPCGYYDDENNYVFDTWYELEKKVLPKSIQDMRCDKRVSNTLYYETAANYMKEHPKEVYKALNKWVSDFKSNTHESNIREPHMVLVGVIIHTIKFYRGLDFYYKFSSKTLPDKFPMEFPKTVVKEGLRSVKDLLKHVDENLMEWESIENRKKALNEELSLFETGKIMEGKIN